MKTSRWIGVIVVMTVAAFSCTKDKIVTKNVYIQKPSLSDSLGLILAGDKGSSKSWKIIALTQKVNNGAPQTITVAAGDIPACEGDNIFKFSNNSQQDYLETEGATVCDSNRPDPTTIEKGSWAFTGDGKGLIVDTWVYPTAAQFQDSANEPFLGYFILSEGEPLTVVTLSSTSMILSYSYTLSTDTYLITLTFAKV